MTLVKRDSDQEYEWFDDIRGNSVEVGDIIAYSVLSGRSATMAVGKVLRIFKRKGTYSERMEPRLSVERMERTYGPTYGDKYGDGPSKPSTLKFWDRCVLVEKGQK